VADHAISVARQNGFERELNSNLQTAEYTAQIPQSSREDLHSKLLNQQSQEISAGDMLISGNEAEFSTMQVTEKGNQEQFLKMQNNLRQL